jgi:hypothetical protein
MPMTKLIILMPIFAPMAIAPPVRPPLESNPTREDRR